MGVGFLEWIRSYFSFLSLSDESRKRPALEVFGKNGEKLPESSLVNGVWWQLRLRLTAEEFDAPFAPQHRFLNDYKKRERPNGSRFPDGTVNWQCDCMGGGSMVAHRCGFFFRLLHKCMLHMDGSESHVRCPEQFVNWVACVRNLTGADRQVLLEKLFEDRTSIKETADNNPDGKPVIPHFKSL